MTTREDLARACEDAGDSYAADEVRRGAWDFRATVRRRMESLLHTRVTGAGAYTAGSHYGPHAPAYVQAALRAMSLAQEVE